MFNSVGKPSEQVDMKYTQAATQQYTPSMPSQNSNALPSNKSGQTKIYEKLAGNCKAC